VIERNKNGFFSELVAGCKRNDRACQEQLYKLYFNTFYHFCTQRGVKQDEAIGIIHDAFLKIYKSIDSLQDTDKFNAWVWTILRNSLTDILRLKAKEYLSLESSDHPGLPSIQPNEHALFDHELNDMLQHLPKTTREVFIQFAMEGYPHEEIAKKLHITASTSRWHVSAARKILQQLYYLRYGK